jgi:hypothetical protein
MKKLISIVALLVLLTTVLASASGDEAQRPMLELALLADLAFTPGGADPTPAFLCDLGLGLRLANGALFARAIASVAVPAEGLIKSGLPAELITRVFEIGSNPLPGVYVGARLRITENSRTPLYLGAIYVHIEQNIKLF